MATQPLATSSPVPSSTQNNKGENADRQRKGVDAKATLINDVDIEPILYSFKTTQSPYPSSIMTATLPPYWLYHDHAFGVIWALFHAESKQIGISQLHWCLRFLLELKNSNGEYTGDVNVCIQAIQDELIEEYAKMGSSLPREPVTQEQSPSTDENAGTNTESTIVSDEQVAKEDEIPNSESGQENTGNLRANATLSSLSRYFESRPCDASCQGPSGSKKATSLTYNEMASRGQDPYTMKTDQQPVRMDADTSEVVAELSKKLNEVSFADMETEELLKFLNFSRQQHVDRIKIEIEKLYGLEKFMENFVDKRSFAAYITEDLATRLDKLQGRDVINKIEGIIE